MQMRMVRREAEDAISAKTVTDDFQRPIHGATLQMRSEFVDDISK